MLIRYRIIQFTTSNVNKSAIHTVCPKVGLYALLDQLLLEIEKQLHGECFRNIFKFDLAYLRFQGIFKKLKRCILKYFSCLPNLMTGDILISKLLGHFSGAFVGITRKSISSFVFE